MVSNKVISKASINKEFTNPFPIQTHLIERESLDLIFNLAVLTKEHALITGKPGTAKSLQAELFFQNFQAEYFSVQLSKFSTEEILFGPLNIEKLRNGKIEYIYKNSILTADFAYIDEIFDASDVLLRTLLGVLNERKFCKGNFIVNTPLQSVIATANYTRSNEITEAVMDRFLFQYHVDPVSDKNQLINFNIPKFQPILDLETLGYYQKLIPQVEINKQYLETYLEIAKHFKFTDRRIRKGLKAMKAHAVLNDRLKIEEHDFEVINFMVGVDPSDIRECARYLNEKIPNSKERNRQLIELKKIQTTWEEEKSSHLSRLHLLNELEIIKNLKKFNPIDEIVAKNRDLILNSIIHHFNEHRQKYVEQNQLREIVNAEFD